ENLLGSLLVQDAHPANSHPLGAGRQPDVLDGQTGAVKIGLGYGRSSKDERTIAATIAGHGEVQWRFQNPFQLESAIETLPLRIFDSRRLPLILRLKQLLDAPADVDRSDEDEVPWLHEAHRRRVVGHLQNAFDHLDGNGIRAKLAHVSSAAHDP